MLSTVQWLQKPGCLPQPGLRQNQFYVLMGNIDHCREARGFEPDDLIESALPGSMDVLGEWTLAADKVVVF